MELTLRSGQRLFAAIAVGVAATIALPAGAQTNRPEVETMVHDYLASHPAEVESIVKAYLIKNSGVLRDALLELGRRRPSVDGADGRRPEAAVDYRAAITANAALLFNSER